jgi:hypothetical protein
METSKKHGNLGKELRLELMSVRKVSENRWVIQVKEDQKTKELYLEFPPDALNQVGWDEGDIILWEELPNGNWSLSKKD